MKEYIRSKETIPTEKIIYQKYSLPCIVDLYDLLTGSDQKTEEEIVVDTKKNLNNLFFLMENGSEKDIQSFCWSLSESSSADIDIQLEALGDTTTIGNYYDNRIKSIPTDFHFQSGLKSLFSLNKDNFEDLFFNYYGRLFNEFLPNWNGSNFDYARCIDIIVSKANNSTSSQKKEILIGHNGSSPLLDINRLKKLIFEEPQISTEDELFCQYLTLKTIIDNPIELDKFLIENNIPSLSSPARS